jgi:hypothetical protein
MPEPTQPEVKSWYDYGVRLGAREFIVWVIFWRFTAWVINDMPDPAVKCWALIGFAAVSVAFIAMRFWSKSRQVI